MPSKARKAFDSNAEDIQRLIDIHSDIGGNARGRRRGLEVLNKSAIVLITAFWEAYCEDIAAEGLAHIIKYSRSTDNLPVELKKVIAKKVKAQDHDLEVWKLSDDGWRKYLQGHLDELKEARDRKLNTPKTAQIDQLFLSAVGVEKISSSWKWARKMTSARAKSKLDRYVGLRGAIAHRGQHETSVTKANVEDYFDFIKRIVGKTGGQVNRHVMKATQRPLWTK